MKYGVIDIGSNSVRLMINADGKTQRKDVLTTRLAEKMGTEKVLQENAIERTASAVSFFVDKAKSENVSEILIFATAAVRQAVNKQVFLDKVKNLTGLSVDVILGEEEARLGAIGALDGKDGGIIDVGGASSEVLIFKNGQIVYSKSIDVGAVKIYNECGQDKDKILQFVNNAVLEYGNIPSAKFYGIGGTATSIASMDLKMATYDPKKVQGHKLSICQIKDMRDMLLDMSVEEKRNLVGLQPDRAEIISGGVALVYEILKMAKVEWFYISEMDNLEGYLMTKRG